jgi:N-carbamoyl-L-amino-acid hydrolase
MSPGAIEAIRATLERVIARVNTLSAGGPGWTRPSYGDLESAAHAMAEEEAHALGMTVRRDAAGNLFARLKGRDPNAVPLHVGSHLDTVAEGGAYDGQAGVAGALALAAGQRRRSLAISFDEFGHALHGLYGGGVILREI